MSNVAAISFFFKESESDRNEVALLLSAIPLSLSKGCLFQTLAIPIAHHSRTPPIFPSQSYISSSCSVMGQG